MGPRRTHPNLLIVEGHDDKYSVVGLMEHHVAWPDGVNNAPVYIDVGFSAEQILKSSYLSAQLKTPNLKAVGIMLDADTKSRSRYQSLRGSCLTMFPALPEEMPKDGLIIDNGDGIRLGIWIMPDNLSGGDFETFLRYLVPEQSEPIWTHGVASVATARHLGSPYRDCHAPKASLYTWLAWQDPPGQSPGLALTKKILDPHSPQAMGFVKWFKELYGL